MGTSRRQAAVAARTCPGRPGSGAARARAGAALRLAQDRPLAADRVRRRARAVDRRHRGAARLPAGVRSRRPDGSRPIASRTGPSSRPPSAARSSTARAASWPTASTPTPSPRSRRKSTTRPRSPRAVCAALDGCTAERRQAIAKNLAKRSSFAYVARQVYARRGEARPRAGAARDHAAEGEPPLLSEQRARRARPRLRRPRQRRARRHRVRLRLARSAARPARS